MKALYSTEYIRNSSKAKYIVKNKCQICKKKFDTHKLDTHHIKPLRLGGSDSLENLMVLCRKCHRREEKKLKSKPEQDTVLLIVDIPDDLHYKLKMKAIVERTTIKEIINLLLNKALQ